METDGQASSVVASSLQGQEETEKDDEEEIQSEKKESKHKQMAERQQSLERRDSLKGKTLYKHGHLKVKDDGQITYKSTPSSAIIKAIQLGLGYSIGKLSAKPERDVLMEDFTFVEKVWFPRSGSKETPAHSFNDFKFKSYAPNAFRYFRDLFGMQPGDFLMSLSNEPLREISNPGASGSLFFLSADDTFIVKTVQHKEATFLQQLLPGYYLNLHQNPRTLLPKFFGLYCYQSQNTNIRLAVMNNLLPSNFKCHQKYDLKGSTYKRKASKAELQKRSPTKKDLDFINDYPEGIILEAETYEAVIKTVKRDCRVLESFKIMDYSMLLGIHNVDQALREKEENSIASSHEVLTENLEQIARGTEFKAALEAIQIDRNESKDVRPPGGIPAKNTKGERLILFLGIIDILQSYRLAKKLEHGWKSMIHDGDTVSVHNPSFYAKRFLDFVAKQIFKKGTPAVTRSASKRKSSSKTGQAPAVSSAVKQRISEVEAETVPVQVKTRTITFADEATSAVPENDHETDPGIQLVPPPYEDKDQNPVTLETDTPDAVSNEPVFEEDNPMITATISTHNDLPPSDSVDTATPEMTTVVIHSKEENQTTVSDADHVVTHIMLNTEQTTPEESLTTTHLQNVKVLTFTTTTTKTEQMIEESGNGDNVVTMETTEVVEQTDPEGHVVSKTTKVTEGEESTFKELGETTESSKNTSESIELAQKDEPTEHAHKDEPIEPAQNHELNHESLNHEIKIPGVSDFSHVEISLTANDVHASNDDKFNLSTGSDNTPL